MPWDPEKYRKFRDERSAPFADLVALIDIRAGMSAIDLGCGTGELTLRLADFLPGSRVLGIDSSPQMLERAKEQKHPGVTFAEGNIADLSGGWNLVFSNAALQWLENHEELLPRLLSCVEPGGQLAVQVPSNHRHPAHTMIIDTAREEPFKTALGGWVRHSPVLEIDRYAELLYRSGGEDITVFEKVYAHILADAEAVAEWTTGTTLVPYFERLDSELRERFLDSYRQKLRELWPRSPVFYTFRRILMAAKRA
ncbi:MAG TPA: methyltransferase domain-containing protein [Geobacteraceae bacterium]|nr:methyltransferase domain-containing protein [Geobacteraceae bacterium]